MKQIGLWFAMALLAVSCNDWLDVRPGTESKEEEQFSSVQGFYDALTGCYMALADQNVYGERLTMSDVEALACLWEVTESENTRMMECYELTNRNYTSDKARAAIKKIYAGLYNVIAQASMIIKYADEQGGVFTDETVRSMIQGEAYAMRAYCQLDVLRLFGQMPQGAGRQVELPYSATTSIDETPAYYGFDGYVKKLEEDLTAAEKLLKGNDPVFEHSFADLNGKVELNSEYQLYRQFRLNYWAVRALHARMALYLGRTDEALAIARELIGATGADGQPVMTMSGREDFKAGYRLCPSECLFCLSKYNVKTYSSEFLGGGGLKQYNGTVHLAISGGRYQALFEGENTASHNRYLACWNGNGVQDMYGYPYIPLMKYWYDEEVQDQTLRFQLIPMLRMSEVYLIAMEASADIEEVNEWYREYMIQHEVPDAVDFASVDEARQWIMDEYRREFFAEGQMFYTYKRRNAAQMLWGKGPVGEETYLLPLPETEYNPNNLQN